MSGGTDRGVRGGADATLPMGAPGYDRGATTSQAPQGVRRAALLDVTILSGVTLFFTVIAFTVVLDRDAVFFQGHGGLKAGYASCLAISWILLGLGGSGCLAFWMRDRKLESTYVLTVTPMNLNLMIACCALCMGGFALVVIAELFFISSDTILYGMSWGVVTSIVLVIALLFIIWRTGTFPSATGQLIDKDFV